MSILLIANPASGGYNRNALEKVKDLLSSRFGTVKTALTSGPGEAGAIAENADEDIIIACGGDGLINETIRGLTGSDKKFSVLPFGTANVLCREYGIPLNPLKAAARLNVSEVRKIPVGYVDEAPFLMMAGFGFDAETVGMVHRSSKRFKFKNLAHLVKGYEVLIKHSFKPMEVYAMGAKREVYHMIVSLGSRYAGNFVLGKAERGRLNVFSVSAPGVWPVLKNVVSVASGRGFCGSHTTADYLKVSGATCCQLDGEFFSLQKAAIFIKIIRNSLNFVY